MHDTEPIPYSERTLLQIKQYPIKEISNPFLVEKVPWDLQKSPVSMLRSILNSPENLNKEYMWFDRKEDNKIISFSVPDCQVLM